MITTTRSAVVTGRMSPYLDRSALAWTWARPGPHRSHRSPLERRGAAGGCYTCEAHPIVVMVVTAQYRDAMYRSLSGSAAIGTSV